MVLNRFIILPSSIDYVITEHKYLYYYHTPYEFVDATFLHLSGSSVWVLSEFRRYVLKLMYLNPSADEDTICESCVSTLLNGLYINGTVLLESDIYRIVNEVFYGKIPKDVSLIVKSGLVKRTIGGKVVYREEILKKRIRWKKNIDELLVLTKEQENMLGLLKKTDKERKTKEIFKKLKRETAMKIINNEITKGNYEKINIAMDVLQDEGSEYGISDVSEVSGLSYATTKKYIEKIEANLNGLVHYRVHKNKTAEMKENKHRELLDACILINKEGKRIIKYNLHLFTGINRITIDRHWSLLEQEVINLNKDIIKK